MYKNSSSSGEIYKTIMQGQSEAGVFLCGAYSMGEGGWGLQKKTDKITAVGKSSTKKSKYKNVIKHKVIWYGSYNEAVNFMAKLGMMRSSAVWSWS